MLTITHTHEAGTIIEGTAKGDGTAAILKANRWRWGRSIGAWFVPNSRDRLPQDHVITRTAAALEAAGFELAPLQIDRTTRSTAEVEAAKAERQAARVDALDAKAERKTGVACEKVKYPTLRPFGILLRSTVGSSFRWSEVVCQKHGPSHLRIGGRGRGRP